MNSLRCEAMRTTSHAKPNVLNEARREAGLPLLPEAKTVRCGEQAHWWLEEDSLYVCEGHCRAALDPAEVDADDGIVEIGWSP